MEVYDVPGRAGFQSMRDAYAKNVHAFIAMFRSLSMFNHSKDLLRATFINIYFVIDRGILCLCRKNIYHFTSPFPEDDWVSILLLT